MAYIVASILNSIPLANISWGNPVLLFNMMARGVDMLYTFHSTFNVTFRECTKYILTHVP